MVLLQPVKKERELLVEPHARARIACDLTNVTNLRWYKDSEVSIIITTRLKYRAFHRNGVITFHSLV